MEIGRSQGTHFSTIQSKQEVQVQAKKVDNVKEVAYSDIEKKVDSVNQFLKNTNTNIKFNLHEDLNEYYITVIDEVTKEVIKEVPPKKLLDIYAAMVKTLGIFIDKKI
ncbi:flagellar protein FlaG [Bacillus alkalicellulosilyticus]|uniref:flagellar protein FlaG n=1 Tax=Alkalihalobacterium alkalicellulosilyticum TaxID=1912214 RepID=UPI0009966E12|nr:flagellar protein FlaG [Bacillus alkalicellulosilyticus]